MGNLGFQELLLIVVSLFYIIIPVAFFIWLYRTSKRSKVNLDRINKLEIQVQVLEALVKKS